jgi:hypothetical protein
MGLLNKVQGVFLREEVLLKVARELKQESLELDYYNNY